MFQRRTAITAVVGAAIGVLILQALYSSIAWWYGTSMSPLVLLLAPGIVVAGMLNPMYSPTYFLVASVTQAVSYAAVAVGVSALLRRNSREGKDAV